MCGTEMWLRDICSSLPGITSVCVHNTHSRYFPKVVYLSIQTVSIKSQKFSQKNWAEAYGQFDHEYIKFLGPSGSMST